jgi:uncharacterized protein
LSVSSQQLLAPRARWLSALELLIGSALVIGHNVFRVVPNEVPILVVLAIMSMRLRSGRWDWSSLGFKRPASWKLLVLIAVGAAALRLLLGAYLIDPVTSHFWPSAKAPAGADEVTGNLRVALLYLPIVWGFAAFGEEIGYRGYLLNRAADGAGGTSSAYWVAVIVTAVLFGYGHYYKGPAGILDSGMAGLILGAAYIISGRNLWTTVLAHGLIDTCSLTLLYLGWDT